MDEAALLLPAQTLPVLMPAELHANKLECVHLKQPSVPLLPPQPRVPMMFIRGQGLRIQADRHRRLFSCQDSSPSPETTVRRIGGRLWLAWRRRHQRPLCDTGETSLPADAEFFVRYKAAFNQAGRKFKLSNCICAPSPAPPCRELMKAC